jgi:hypothetical protein
VFDLIRDNNLFADVQDQALQLVEFDHELMEKRKQAGEAVEDTPGSAITLLVDHIHSIPVGPLSFDRVGCAYSLVTGTSCRPAATATATVPVFIPRLALPSRPLYRVRLCRLTGRQSLAPV